MDANKRKELEAQLSAYLDGELSAQQRAEVEAFLADDAEARKLFEELRSTIELVQGLPQARASDKLLEGLRNRLERRALLGATQPVEPAPSSTAPFEGKWIAAAAVIALTFAAAYVMWSFTGQDQPIGGIRDQYVFHEELKEAPSVIPASPKPPADTKAEKAGGIVEGEATRSEESFTAGTAIPPPPAPPPPAKQLFGRGKGRELTEQIELTERGVGKAGISAQKDVDQPESADTGKAKKKTPQSEVGRQMLAIFSKLQRVTPTTAPDGDTTSLTYTGTRARANQPVALPASAPESVGESVTAQSMIIRRSGICLTAPTTIPATQPAAASQPTTTSQSGP